MTTTITAFNGVPAGGKPVILLHTYSQTPVQTTLILVGTVSNLNKEGFGPRLDVEIPLIAGGQGAITGFHVNIFKTFKLQRQETQLRQLDLPDEEDEDARKIRLQGRRIADPVGDAEVLARSEK